jgi:hypothetical protein
MSHYKAISRVEIPIRHLSKREVTNLDE